MVDRLIENHVIAALDLEIEIPMTKMGKEETAVGVEIKSDEAKGAVENGRAKVEEVEVRIDPKSGAVGAGNAAINAVEVKVGSAKDAVEVKKGKEVEARKEVAFVELVAVVPAEALLLSHQRQDLVVDLVVLGVVPQLTYH